MTGTWGPGSALAQGEVVPDRWVLGAGGEIEREEPGRKDRRVVTTSAGGTRPQAVDASLVHEPSLARGDVVALGPPSCRASSHSWACPSRSSGRRTMTVCIFSRRARCASSRAGRGTTHGSGTPGSGTAGGNRMGNRPGLRRASRARPRARQAGDVLVTQVAGSRADRGPAPGRRCRRRARREHIAPRRPHARARHPGRARRDRRDPTNPRGRDGRRRRCGGRRSLVR